jgi:hypothetical protein
MLAAALCAEARAFTRRNGGAAVPPLGISAVEMEDFFLTLTEKALEAVPNDVLIAILAGRMRGKLEQTGFDMDKILPTETEGGDTEPETVTDARVYGLRA